jgi:hypothetical protein
MPKIQVQYACTATGNPFCHGTGVVWVEWLNPVAFTEAVKVASPAGWSREGGDDHLCVNCAGVKSLQRDGLKTVRTR